MQVDIHHIHDIDVYVILLKREEYQSALCNVARTPLREYILRYSEYSIKYKGIKIFSAQYDESIKRIMYKIENFKIKNTF